MACSLRVPLLLPVLKINGKTYRAASVLCCLRTLGIATQDLIQNSELRGKVFVFLAGAKKVVGNDGAAPLSNCTVNSATLYFTDLVIDREIMNKIHYPYQTVLKDVIHIHQPKFVWRNVSLVAKVVCRVSADVSSIPRHPFYVGYHCFGKK